MAARKTYFSNSWLDKKLYPEFGGWLEGVPGDSSVAKCKVCSKKIKLSNMGINAVRSHLMTPTHKKMYAASCAQISMALFTARTSTLTETDVRTNSSAPKF
uniref:BED-type domain-containing protein n=1 Tax=Cacopsylla melanoneura TaxID=428564 RepID=A0A8D8S0U8_9HEMI